MQRNNLSVEEPYLAESQNRSFLGYAGLILLLAGAILFVATFVMDSGAPKLPPPPLSSAAPVPGEPEPEVASATVANGW